MSVTKKILLMTVIALAGSFVSAQGISPVVQVIHANKHGEANGSFAILNESIRPIVSLLSVRPVVFDETGRMTLGAALTGAQLILNASSIKIPPKSQSNVDFKTVCPTSCAFLVLTGDTTEKKVESGLNVRLVLAETIYVESQAIRKDEIRLTRTSPTTLLVENLGDGFDRPDVDVHADGKTMPMPSFPLMPHGKRIETVPDKADVTLRFEKFTLKNSQ